MLDERYHGSMILSISQIVFPLYCAMLQSHSGILAIPFRTNALVLSHKPIGCFPGGANRSIFTAQTLHTSKYAQPSHSGKHENQKTPFVGHDVLSFKRRCMVQFFSSGSEDNPGSASGRRKATLRCSHPAPPGRTRSLRYSGGFPGSPGSPGSRSPPLPCGP